MLTAVVCSGRNRPQDSKGQCDARPIERRSYAAAMNRNNSCAPVSSNGANPTSSSRIRSLRRSGGLGRRPGRPRRPVPERRSHGLGIPAGHGPAGLTNTIARGTVCSRGHRADRPLGRSGSRHPGDHGQDVEDLVDDGRTDASGWCTAAFNRDRPQLFDGCVTGDLESIGPVSFDLDVTRKGSPRRRQRHDEDGRWPKPKKGIGAHHDARSPEPRLGTHRHAEVHLDDVARVHRPVRSGLSHSSRSAI